jgi:hypothetical protein
MIAPGVRTKDCGSVVRFNLDRASVIFDPIYAGLATDAGRFENMLSRHYAAVARTPKPRL